MVWPDLILISSSQRKKCDFTASSQRKTGFLASLQRKTWFTASSQRGYSAKRGLQRVHRAKARISIRYRSWDWPDIPVQPDPFICTCSAQSRHNDTSMNFMVSSCLSRIAS